MFRLVRPDTIGTDFQLFPIPFLPGKGSGTMFHFIKRAIAEQTVQFFQPFVAWIELTVFIGEKAIGIICHTFLLRHVLTGLLACRKEDNKTQ